MSDDQRTDGRWWKAKWALPDGGPTYSDIWARDISEARRICAQLGFEEPKRARQEPYEFRVSRLVAASQNGLANADVLHTLCYLSTLAGRAGVATTEELVGDGSPLHELSHYLGLSGKIRRGRAREFVLERIAWLESIIPGIPPIDIELPIGNRMPSLGRSAEETEARCHGADALRYRMVRADEDVQNISDRSDSTIPDAAIEKAISWRASHSDHVAKLVASARCAYPPTGSDVIRPELWKDAHWRWLREAQMADERKTTTYARDRLKVSARADGQWIVSVNDNPRRWFSTEAEAEAFIDGYDNAVDNHLSWCSYAQ